MDDNDWLARQFEAQRDHLQAVAYRMLGSLAEADDAVQDAWLKLSRVDTAGIDNLGGWLTTVVGRVCLDMLRARAARREDALGVHLPDPIVSHASGLNPEDQAVLADSVGLALLVVLQTLTPAERLAFVLHDLFAVPFDQIAPIVDRSPAAAKMLASRARRRVRGAAADAETDVVRQREVVDAFLAASRGGDFDALVALLDPDIVLRVEAGPGAIGESTVVRGAAAVASQALSFARFSPLARPALVNGSAGFVAVENGAALSVAGFTIVRGRIIEIDIIADPRRLQAVDVSALDE